VTLTPVTFPSMMSTPSTAPNISFDPFSIAAFIILVVSSSGVTCAVVAPVHSEMIPQCIQILESIFEKMNTDLSSAQNDILHSLSTFLLKYCFVAENSSRASITNHCPIWSLSLAYRAILHLLFLLNFHRLTVSSHDDKILLSAPRLIGITLRELVGISICE
jgi:hypothetical protein